MIGLIIVLVMALGVGGTIVASDDARPGDALFKVDQAVENVRISLAGKERKNELRVRFAEERIKEVRELEEEGKIVNGPTESLTVEQEAEVTAGIEFALDLLADLDEIGEVEDVRLEGLADQLSAYLDDLPDDARVQVSDGRLRIKFDNGPEKIEIKGQGEDKTKIEVRTEEGRLRVEVKDGLIEIKTKVEDDEKDELEAEAEILSDKTIVEVEVGDEKTTFATSANTREGIIAAIIAKFPNLSADQVRAVLKIETEDSDEDEDLNDDSDDEDLDDEDEDLDFDDDDEDDDDDDDSGSNSGSGR